MGAHRLAYPLKPANINLHTCRLDPRRRRGNTRGDQLADRESIAAGSVITQASAMFLIVLHCNPDPFAAIAPATPLDRVGARTVGIDCRFVGVG